jgi:hypothetical protein
VLLPPYAILIVAYGFSPRTLEVGFMPHQPVPYSHDLHAGQLGIDCRYCHNTVETSDFASIPPTQTCMNCHTQIMKDSPKIKPLLESYTTGKPVLWERVHELPDYVYFSHAAHVTRGVSCVECHGRVDRMPEVYQHEMLSMGWCLDCHREPNAKLGDPKNVVDLGWAFEHDLAAQSRFTNEAEYRQHWRTFNNLNPSQDCSTCHR